MVLKKAAGTENMLWAVAKVYTMPDGQPSNFIEVLKMQKMMSHMRSAMEKYNMITAGDRVAVGLSGGKDSTAMLVALANIRRFYPEPFELVAISLDPCFGGEETDFSPLQKLCEDIGVEYIIKRT